jgi:DNA processing protein
MDEEEELYRIAVSFVPGMRIDEIRTLLATLGSARAVFQKENLEQFPRLNPKSKSALLSGELLVKGESERKAMKENQISGKFILDSDYPEQLKDCPDAPIMLYVKGHCDLNANKILAVVGTRKATPLGKESTQMLIQELSRHVPDLLIVSGLAYGIDVIAHQSAMQHGLKTVGIMAHGLHEVYPPYHRKVAENMRSMGGALISEYAFGIPSLPYRFRERNRIIAGMSNACIVVESGLVGGSLKTAEYARDYNRDVMAFPGRNIDPFSSGCNKLIKQRSAALIESAEDVLKEMNWTSTLKPRVRQQSLFSDLKAEQKVLLELLDYGETLTENDLIVKTSFSVHEILTHLLEMEMSGLIERMPGGRYRKRHSFD